MPERVREARRPFAARGMMENNILALTTSKQASGGPCRRDPLLMSRAWLACASHARHNATS